MSPPVYLSINQVEINKKQILHIYVPIGSQVQKCKDKIFDRNEDGDFDITNNQTLITQLYLKKQTTYSEVELASHDFYKHIFPQITKFLGFILNNKEKQELIEKIYTIIDTNEDIKNDFKHYLGEKELFKTIKESVETCQNILLVIDNDKKELPEIQKTYSDTWDKLVKILKVNYYMNGQDKIFSIMPDFENIDYTFIQEGKDEEDYDAKYTEKYHLDGVNDEIEKSFKLLKERLIRENKEVKFNSRKYYIAITNNRNIAYIRAQKKKLKIVVMLSYHEVKMKIKKHIVKKLSSGVQNFYGDKCSEIEISSEKNINEIINLLKPLITK
ncbi:TPA: hypothetical protein DCW38_04870 [candidate division WOR-3 bacterium]|jgi:predicted transport protein|uniref:DUF5655 domain-containing protein n=1 Tax=candidate division WOR-3 bacterium TaxID=2052148 RepID=A0A350HAD0_UNCW3|nr:hypothetical protein [candidate division WOR-3 bacterium]